MAERSPMIAVALITGICAIGAAVAGNMVGLLGPRLIGAPPSTVASTPPETPAADVEQAAQAMTVPEPQAPATQQAAAVQVSDPAPARPPAQMRSLQYRVNLPGNDLGAGLPVTLPSECSDLCQQNDRCVAMTYVRHAAGIGGVCWLKSAVASTEPNDDMISAIKDPR